MRCRFRPLLSPWSFFSVLLFLATLFSSPALLAVAGDTPGNLLLFFRETDATALGANDNVTIDLGSYPSNQTGFRYDFSGNSIISQTYGNNWFQRDTLFWGIMGFISYADPVAEGDPNKMNLFISRESTSTVLGQMTGVSLYDLAQKWPDLIVNLSTGRNGTTNVSGTDLSYSVFEKGQKAWSDMQEDPSGAFGGAISYTGNSDHQVTMNPDLILSQYTPDPVDFGNKALSVDLLSIRFTNGILSATAISGASGISNGIWIGASGNWNIASNWTNAQPASDGSTAGIAGIAGGMITNNAVTNLTSLTYSNTAGAFTLIGANGSQTLTITGGITNNSTSTQTILLSLNTTANQTFNAAAGNLSVGAISNTVALTMQESTGKAISVNGAITGNGSLIQSGSGTLNLNVANSYGGGTTLNGGTVVAGNNASFGIGDISAASDATIAAGAQGLFILNTLNISAGSTATIDSAGTSFSLSGPITGGGSLAKSGSGTLSLLGNSSSFSGATTVNTGRLQVSGNLGTGTVTVRAGASLTGSGSVGALSLSQGGTIMAGTDSSIGTLSITGNGIWNGGGSYNWKISDANAAAGGGYDTLAIGGTLDLSGVTSGNKFQINLWSLGGNAASFNKDTDWYWKIASFNSLAGTFSTDLFSVNLGATNGTGGFLNALNGDFSLTTSADALFLSYKTRAATDTGGIWSGGSGNLTGITNNSLLQFTGSGGSVTNQSVTNLTGITYGITAGSYTLSGTNLTLSGGVTNSSSAQQTIATAVRLASNAVLQSQSGGILVGGSLDLSSNNLTISGARQSALTGDIAGSGTLIKQGTGSLVMSGVSSNAGGLAVETGRVLLSGGDDRLSFNGRLSVAGGAILDLGTTSQRFVALSGSGTITGGSGSITLAPTNSIAYAGTIEGQKSVVQNGVGTSTLSGSNSYTGGTVVAAGTLVASSSNAIGNSLSSVSVRGGTLDLGGLSRSMGSVTLTSGEISNGTFSATNLVVQVVTNQQATLSATLAGNKGFWKMGAGTLNFLSSMPKGTNIISAGTLRTAGSVGGAESNALGKIIVGGSSPAIWTNTGNLTLASNGKTILELRDGASLRSESLTIASAAASQGTLLITGTGASGDSSINVGSGTISFGSGAGKIEYQKSSSMTLSESLAGKGMLTVSGKGTLTLAGGNSGFGGTNYLTSGGMVISSNTANGGTALVSGKKSTLTLERGASLSNTNALHAVAGKLVDNSGLAFTNSIRSSRIVTNGALRPGILLATGGTMEKSYAATSDMSRNISGFGAGFGSGKSFQILAGTVSGSSTLSATSTNSNGNLANGILDFHGTGTNAFVMAMTDASFTASRNQIQWLNTNSATPFWTNTIAGNTGNKTNAAISGMNGVSFAGSFNSFLLQTSLRTAGITSDLSATLLELNSLGAESIAGLLNNIMGAYGFDSTTKTAWAVINHNSLFDSLPGAGWNEAYAPLNSSLDTGLSSTTAQVVPEPGTWALMIIGGGALILAARAKRRERF